MVFVVSANTNSWPILSVVAALGVWVALAGCASSPEVSVASPRIETQSMTVAPTRVGGPDAEVGSLQSVPRSSAPLGGDGIAAAAQGGVRAEVPVNIDDIYHVGADSVEPLMLTNEAASLTEFLEDGARPILPRFELRAPIVASANWSESPAGSSLDERFNQSGAMIGASFDESGTMSNPTVDRPQDHRPWVSAVDDARWNIGVEALAIVGITPQELGFPILFAGPNGRKKGTTFTVDRHIEVYIADNDSVRDVAHVVAHEFGHAVDVSANSPQDRYRWLSARGLGETTPWWPGQDGTDLTTGAGDFAECFASWRASVASRSLLAGSCQDQFPLLQELWEQAR